MLGTTTLGVSMASEHWYKNWWPLWSYVENLTASLALGFFFKDVDFICETFDSFPLRHSFMFGSREVGVRGGKSWGDFTAQWFWTKLNSNSRPDSNKTFLPLPMHTSFHFCCHSQMLLMFKKQPETEPTRPRHKEHIKPSKQIPSRREFNQRFEIIKEPEFVLPSSHCSAQPPNPWLNSQKSISLWALVGPQITQAWSKLTGVQACKPSFPPHEKPDPWDSFSFSLE